MILYLSYVPAPLAQTKPATNVATATEAATYTGTT